MSDFLSGAQATGLAVCALFFLRFYRQTRDRLFLFFALAFSILSANRAALALVAAPDEVRAHFYLLRLIAFVLILAAIADKNRSRRGT